MIFLEALGAFILFRFRNWGHFRTNGNFRCEKAPIGQDKNYSSRSAPESPHWK